jgi:hypothetical protein
LSARGEWGTQRRHWAPQDAVAALQAMATGLGRTPGKRDWDKAREQHGLGSSDAVGRDGFGSWREFQRAAGLEPNAPHHKITGATAAGVVPGRNRQMVTGGSP